MQRLTLVLSNHSGQLVANNDPIINTTTNDEETDETINPDYQHSTKWLSINADVALAFGLIIFYALFVLFILFIVIRIVVTICMTTNRVPKSKNPKIKIRSEYGSDTSNSSNSCRTRTVSHSFSMVMMMVDDSLRSQNQNHQQSDLSSSSFLDPNHHRNHHNFNRTSSFIIDQRR